jgi:hypothetical protein
LGHRWGESSTERRPWRGHFLQDGTSSIASIHHNLILRYLCNSLQFLQTCKPANLLHRNIPSALPSSSFRLLVDSPTLRPHLRSPPSSYRRAHLEIVSTDRRFHNLSSTIYICRMRAGHTRLTPLACVGAVSPTPHDASSSSGVQEDTKCPLSSLVIVNLADLALLLLERLIARARISFEPVQHGLKSPSLPPAPKCCSHERRSRGRCPSPSTPWQNTITRGRTSPSIFELSCCGMGIATSVS